MKNDLVQYVLSQGSQINEQQIDSLVKSEEYLKKNKIFELFDVSSYRNFGNFTVLSGVNCENNC